MPTISMFYGIINGVRLIRPGYHRHNSPQPSGPPDSPPTGDFTFFRPC